MHARWSLINQLTMKEKKAHIRRVAKLLKPQDDTLVESEDSEDSLILKGKSGKSGNRKGKSSRILKRRPNSDWDPCPNGGL